MALKPKYEPSKKEAAFLATVQNGKYDRDIITGLKKFYAGTVPQDMQGFYSEGELEAIKALDGTERDLQARMPVKITRHYFEMARNSAAIQALVKASPKRLTTLTVRKTPASK